MNEDKEKEFLADLEKMASAYDIKPLQEYDAPEIRASTQKRNKESSKWTALKNEILTRIYNLAPASWKCIFRPDEIHDFRCDVITIENLE